jgi:D-serine deaminase-like pyridoxal phosphate-dependent protein
MQIEAGATGVTCATVGEAAAMAAAGIEDILIANQVVTREKLVRIAAMLNASQVKFVVDSRYGIELAEAVAEEQGCSFELLVEVNTGGNRCGAETPQEAVSLVEGILDSPFLRFGGVQAYYGGTSYIKDLQERQRAVDASDQVLHSFLEAIRQVSELPRVSGAGTGNAALHLRNGLLSEIQSGSYVYADTTYRELAPEYRPALSVLATTLSRPVESRVVMDVGLKGIGTEFSDPEVVGYPDLKQYRFSEEHLQWQVDDGQAPQVGEKVLIIPSHCCSTVNLHRRCYVMDQGLLVDSWIIDGF